MLTNPKEQRIAVRGAQRADQIRDILATPLQRLCPGVVVSIVRVTLSPDEKRATVWVRFYPTTDASSYLGRLRRSVRAVQRALDEGIARKYAPHISIQLDVSAEKEAQIESLLL